MPPANPASSSSCISDSDAQLFSISKQQNISHILACPERTVVGVWGSSMQTAGQRRQQKQKQSNLQQAGELSVHPQAAQPLAQLLDDQPAAALH